MKGTVKRLLVDKGFGFITGEDRVDYFVHHSAMQGCKLEDLREGREVEFTPGDGAKGPRAEDVSLV